MRSWFQNLNEQKNRLFHFRGTIGSDDYRKEWLNYEFASGPAFGFRLKPRVTKTSISIGLFFFTMYLTIHGLVIPFIKKNRGYEFDIRHWEIWIHIANREWETSSTDPWYHTIVISPLDLIFGKSIYFTKEIMESYGPVEFWFRGKKYQMDEIKIEKCFWFRSRIPFGLYRKEKMAMRLDIKKPPGYQGKGENSWDCGDDATYGLSATYEGPEPTWKNKEKVFEWCCDAYCERVSKSIKRYGRVADDREMPADKSWFKFIGSVKANDGSAQETPT